MPLRSDQSLVQRAISKSRFTQIKKRRRRKVAMELLERRDLLVAAVWNNPVFPLDVTSDQPALVSPIDALLVINWLNNPNLPSLLPKQDDLGLPQRHVDTNCDGHVSPIDALLVINYINRFGAGVVGGFSTDGGTFANAACSPQLLEGTSFSTELDRVLRIPAGKPGLQVSFQAPEFDSSAMHEIRDAFELIVTAADGSPISNPLSSSRPAAFNWTEGLQPVSAHDTWSIIQPTGTDSKVTFDLSGLSPGTEIRVLARLVNNDGDDNTSVIIRGYEFVELPNDTLQASESLANSRVVAQSGFDIQQLVDLTGSFDVEYGRTSLNSDKTRLVSQASLMNVGSQAVLGPLVAVFENFTDPNVFMLHPDGILKDGRPYVNLTDLLNLQPLASGASIVGPDFAFLNNANQRFQFQLKIYGQLNPGPAGFRTRPETSIEAGRPYRYDAQAIATIDPQLVYTKVSGPEGLTIDSVTGRVDWNTAQEDIGTVSITIRAMDRYGLYVDQEFSLQVFESLQNRPPLFVTSPGTEAVAAGSFDIVTVATGAEPMGLAVGALGTSSQLSLVAINAQDQSLSFINGLGHDQYSLPQNIGVGLPPRADQYLQTGYDVDLGLTSYGYNSWNQIEGFAQGDLNGDGILDLVSSQKSADRDVSAIEVRHRSLKVALGRDDGSFEPAVSYTVPNAVPQESQPGLVSLQVFDFDGDGVVDVLGNDFTAQQLLFFRGLGDGTMADPVASTNATPLSYFLVTDFNDDGQLDLLAENASSSSFGIRLGDGSGHFGPYQEILSVPGVIFIDRAFAFGDLDGDGDQDIVLGSWNGRSLHVFLNDGDAQFTASVTLPSTIPFANSGPTNTTYVSIADFTGDGNADIVYGVIDGQGLLGLYAGDGSGSSFTYSDAARAFPPRPGNTLGNNQPIDFDGDGDLDVVLMSYGFNYTQNLGVLVGLNDGSGRFDVTTYYDSSSGTEGSYTNTAIPLGLFTRDYNHDGMLDVLTVATNRNQNRDFSGATVLLAERNGQLMAPYDMTVNPQPNANVAFVLAGDFNNDGLLDVWGPRVQGSSFTRLGNGDGTFQPEIVATPNIGNEFLTKGFTADFDHDGKLDVFWLGNDGIQGGPAGRYLAAMGDGDGSFEITFAMNVPGGFAGSYIVIPRDFNGDGYIDFAAGSSGAFGAGPFVEIWLYDPNNRGTFVQSDRKLVSRGPGALTVDDFTADGIDDIAVILPRETTTTPAELWIFSGNGDGTLNTPAAPQLVLEQSLVTSPQWAASGDLNHDGLNDIVVKGAYFHSAVLLGKPNGEFEPARDYVQDAYFDSYSSVTLYDLDGDGNLDLITSGDGFSNLNRGRLSIRRGIGDGTFSPAEHYDVQAGNGTFVLGDFDLDGRQDIVFHSPEANPGAFSLLSAQRDGLTSIVTTNVNSDPWLDVVAINNSNAHVTVLLGDHLGQFQRQPDLLVDAGPVAVATGDVNGDGLPDIITANRTGQSISVLVASADSYVRSDFDVGQALTDIEVRDVDHNGTLDVLVADDRLNAAFVLLGDGQGQFAAPLPIAIGEKPASFDVMDINGDGELDLAVVLPGSQRVMFLFGDGAANFGQPFYLDVGASIGQLASGDFNQDGLVDLAMTFPDDDQVAIFNGMGLIRFSRPQRIRAGKTPSSLVAQDANGDGRLDLLVTNSGDDTASVILNRFDPTHIYRYDALAVDPDNDPIQYELIDSPGGMILDAATGEIRWAPNSDQVGLQRVLLRASDGQGGIAEQVFSIGVEPARTNAPPVFTSDPNTTISASESLHFQVNAIDRDHDTLRYRLVAGPDGASIDAITGAVTWDPREQALAMSRTLGESRSVTVPNSGSLNVSSVTAEGWFLFDRVGVNSKLISKKLNRGFDYSFAMDYVFGTLRAGVGTDPSLGARYAWTPNVGQWYHLAMTFDVASGDLFLFIDGVVVTSFHTSSIIETDNNPLILGSTNGEEFYGSMTQLRIWDHARTVENIRQDMHTLVAPNAAGLIADYRFQEGDSDSVVDSSIQRNDGHFSGTFAPQRVPGLAPSQVATFVVRVEDGRGGIDEQTLTVNVASVLTGTISGTLFDDENLDGIQQSGELGQDLWTVYLDSNRNGHRELTEPATLTDSNGKYTFAGLPQGEYRVAVEPQAQFESPSYADIFLDFQQSLVHDTALRAKPLGQLRGTVLLDLDQDTMTRESQTVYSVDFGGASPALEAWTSQSLATSPSGEQYLGPFAKDHVSLTIGSNSTPLPPHDELTISFDLYLVGLWFGNRDFGGPFQ
ncbi:MAG: VCBS repeat-containing protein, partial [Planctomycetales bacterium]|nr:VCBS repeat-containing protein [Planctomycetales bacterium]